MTVPSHLTGSVGLLRTWMANEADFRPVVLTGSVGSGRHYWIRAVLAEYGYKPVFVSDQAPVNPVDLAGNRRIAIRELSRWSMPDDKCIVIAEDPPKQAKDVLIIGFPRPPLPSLQSLCSELGVPPAIATADDNYLSLMTKIRVYQVTGLVPETEHRPNESWADFKRGAKPPYEGPMLAYWLLSNIDPKNWRANRMLWFMYTANSKSDTKVPAAIIRMLMNGVRVLMPSEPKFPAVLRYMPAKTNADMTNSTKSPPAVEVKSMPKSYTIAW